MLSHQTFIPTLSVDIYSCFFNFGSEPGAIKSFLIQKKSSESL